MYHMGGSKNLGLGESQAYLLYDSINMRYPDKANP